MDKMIDKLGLYLSLATLRHRILAGNIANAETPHYKSFDLVFKDIFRKPNSVREVNMWITNKRHLRPAYLLRPKAKITTTPPLIVGLDGNQVSMEYQMAQLAENTLEYEIAARLLAKKLEQIKFVIAEGR